MSRLAPWRIAGFAATLLSVSPAAAHPHVWIDYTVNVLFDDNDLTGVRISWTFDQMYSSMLFHDYTSRPKGALSAEDIASLEKNAFVDTADEHYFIDIALNGETVPIKSVTDFTARFENHRMIYAFTVPIAAGAAPAHNTLKVDAFDYEYYIDFGLAKNAAVSVTHGEKLAAACAPHNEDKVTTTFGPIQALVVVCTYGKTG